MKRYISMLLLAVCMQLSAGVLGSDMLIKGTAKLDGKDIPMWFNIVGDGVVEVGNGKNAAISQYAEGRLVVPAHVVNAADGRNYRIEKVASFAFSLCSKLSGVVFEEGIAAIGEQAFSGCSGLQTVSLPASLTSIDRGAFMGCKSLTHAALPEALAAIGQEAFAENQFADKTMLLPKGVATIALGAFQDCPLQVVVLSPALTSVEEDAFKQAGSCDFYMFDGHAAPTVHPKSVGIASHWYATKPQNYAQGGFCNGLLPVTAMVPNEVFTADGISYKVVNAPEYPGVFTASAHERVGNAAWNSTFNDLSERVTNPTFAGRWKPLFHVNGILPTFFAGEGIAYLHHIALPAHIDARLSARAFAQCKGLVSLDLQAMKPFSEGECKALLEGLADNTIVYAPKGQEQAYREANMVLTNNDGQRHTNHFKLNLDQGFDGLSVQSDLTYSLPYPFMAERASFYRASFKDKKKETLVLPFAANVRSMAYTFDGVEKQVGTDATVKFAKTQQLLANTPYIYVADGTEIGAENVEVSTQMSASPAANSGLCGTYKAGQTKALAAEQQLAGAVYAFNGVGDKGKAAFVPVNDNDVTTPFHAFLHLKGQLAGQNINLVFEGEPTTGIEMQAVDGKMERDVWFNLQGVRLNAKPHKGVYIRNGKKMLIR